MIHTQSDDREDVNIQRWCLIHTQSDDREDVNIQRWCLIHTQSDDREDVNIQRWYIHKVMTEKMLTYRDDTYTKWWQRRC